MGPRDYWQECVAQSLDEHGVTATDEQINAIASDIEGAHENYGMAFYQPSGPSQSERDLKEAQRKLRAEQEKVTCRECKGRGRIILNGPYHSSNSECHKCRGEGRHAP
jgi:DnaJ-class molecular chaperone